MTLRRSQPNRSRTRRCRPSVQSLVARMSALITDGNDAGNDLYCVRAGKRRQIPVKSEGIAKALLSPPGATLTGLLVTVEADGGTAHVSKMGDVAAA